MNQWWKNTVFYEIYVKSFCAAGQNGESGFRGIISKLPYLKELGVGGIWLTFYPLQRWITDTMSPIIMGLTRNTER